MTSYRQKCPTVKSIILKQAGQKLWVKVFQSNPSKGHKRTGIHQRTAFTKELQEQRYQKSKEKKAGFINTHFNKPGTGNTEPVSNRKSEGSCM